jgi:hypothetical protein
MPALDMIDEPGSDLLEIGGEVEFRYRFATFCVRPKRLINRLNQSKRRSRRTGAETPADNPPQA